jgi:hypothetical protein
VTSLSLFSRGNMVNTRRNFKLFLFSSE